MGSNPTVSAPAPPEWRSVQASSKGFSPADIEFAARKASQRALESAVYSNSQSEGPSTDDYLWAVADTRMTVSSEMAGQFLEDIENLARL